jgi:hypothetical protein
MKILSLNMSFYAYKAFTPQIIFAYLHIRNYKK